MFSESCVVEDRSFSTTLVSELSVQSKGRRTENRRRSVLPIGLGSEFRSRCGYGTGGNPETSYDSLGTE